MSQAAVALKDRLVDREANHTASLEPTRVRRLSRARQAAEHVDGRTVRAKVGQRIRLLFHTLPRERPRFRGLSVAGAGF
jgi:hypothetical protein